MKKHILITNDDGFNAQGLLALIDALKPFYQLTIVAPATEKSACAHSLTLTKPLRFISVADDFYKLDDGTPTDCIYLSLFAMFENNKPDLVLSGINRGANMGEDITYSGTAAGAMEAALHGVPAVAISQVLRSGDQSDIDYTLATQSIVKLVERIFTQGFPLSKREFINMNVPNIAPDECKGVKITHAGYRHYGNDAHLHRNPRGEEYYWLGLHPLEWGVREGVAASMSDFDAIKEGYISLTPVKLDMTAYERQKALQAWHEI
ncbi:MAG: stationary phase survival protein SurE [Sulfuricurvum sp. PC08-66]|nr:MAG: stationary phase survival protein SurE [Sulfuricurvum sp. PC08-66]